MSHNPIFQSTARGCEWSELNTSKSGWLSGHSSEQNRLGGLVLLTSLRYSGNVVHQRRSVVYVSIPYSGNQDRFNSQDAICARMGQPDPGSIVELLVLNLSYLYYTFIRIQRFCCRGAYSADAFADHTHGIALNTSELSSLLNARVTAKVLPDMQGKGSTAQTCPSARVLKAIDRVPETYSVSELGEKTLAGRQKTHSPVALVEFSPIYADEALEKAACKILRRRSNSRHLSTALYYQVRYRCR